ncbi:MAG: GNAT family N-acetyltransferase [Pseudazoarcus pumilus]|nr:GNAT family N-acetyltransferase [Pseudazoarcus pumilus]
MADQLIISTMSREELDIAIDWAAQEGWNPGLQDGNSYFTADPQGFLIGRVDGSPVATISVVRYGDFGFLGFYIVHPEWRGRGHGWTIWQAGMRRLAGCNVALDGVVAQQDNYRKSGFRLAWRNMRFEGFGRGVGTAPDARIVPLSGVSFDDYAAWDRAFFPAERPAFQRAWITQPGATALGLVEHGRLAGHGVIRPCRKGWKIAPLCAARPELAEALFAALIAQVPAGEPYYLDVPETNPAALALAGRHGMQLSFETARMYTGPAPELPIERIFGITSFEIG